MNDLTPSGEWSSVAQYEDFVYFGGTGGRVFRVNHLDGRIDTEWAYPIKSVDGLGAIYATPQIQNGSIYGTGYSCTGTSCAGVIFAIPPECEQSTLSPDCRPLEVSLPGRLISTPAVVGNLLVVGVELPLSEGDGEGFLYAIDISADFFNRIQWRLPVDDGIWGDIQPVGNVVYFGTQAGTLYAVDVSEDDRYAANPTGRVQWSFDAGGIVVSTPQIVDDKLYVGTFSGESNFFALDLAARASASDGSYDALDSLAGEWAFSASNGLWASPVIDGETIYVFTLGGEIYALDRSTGNELWGIPTEIDGPIVGTPPIVDLNGTRILAVPSYEGDVHIVEIPNGVYESRIYSTGSGVAASPKLIDGILYAHTLDGKIIGFDPFSLGKRFCWEDLHEDEVKSC